MSAESNDSATLPCNDEEGWCVRFNFEDIQEKNLGGSSWLSSKHARVLDWYDVMFLMSVSLAGPRLDDPVARHRSARLIHNSFPKNCRSQQSCVVPSAVLVRSNSQIVCLFRLRQGAVRRSPCLCSVERGLLWWNGACHSATGLQRGMLLRLA